MYVAVATIASFVEDRLKREEKGATAVEYGLMVGLIAVVIIVAVTALGGRLDTLFRSIVTSLGGTVTT
ncbi:Flp family type IVb pilin [Blastococcus sp. SYSU DS0541]